MLVTNILTAALALATFLLAFFTWKMAQRTAASIVQQERHHRDSMRPYCILTFDNSDERCMFGKQFYDSAQGEKINIRGKVDNKGGGPAKDIGLYLNARFGTSETDVYRLTRIKSICGLIGAGESIPIDVLLTEVDIMTARDEITYRKTVGFPQIANDCYEIVLEYRGVLDGPDNTFRTIHSKGIYQTGTELATTEMAIRPLKPMPIFLVGAQSVRTLNDVPRSQTNHIDS